MSAISKYSYYLKSVVTLLTGFSHPVQILGIFSGWPGVLPAEVRLTRQGWRFAVRTRLDVWVIKETCLDAGYTTGDGIEPDWSVVDIGAGLGDFTVLAAKSCPRGIVHAYEPFGSSYQLLQRNLALNEISNVTPYLEAASGGRKSLASSDLESEAVSTRFVESSEESTRPSVDLGQILDRLPGGRCDLLKIDCEGCEFSLLLDAEPEMLSKIQRITMETHEGYASRTVSDLEDFLAQNGFKVQRHPNPVHSFLGFIYAER